MLLRIKEYTINHEGVPTDGEIYQALQIKETYDDTVSVVLKWYMNYSGWYQVDILESDKTVDDVRKRMPKVYGIWQSEFKEEKSMEIMLGNQTPDQIARRLKIELSEEHKTQLMESWQQKAKDIAKDKWHCFDIPFIMVCGSRETAEKFRDLFLTYDLSKGELFQISWQG